MIYVGVYSVIMLMLYAHLARIGMAEYKYDVAASIVCSIFWPITCLVVLAGMIKGKSK
jgi:hypothetical protein